MNIKEYMNILEMIKDSQPDERVYQTRLIQQFLEDAFEKYIVKCVEKKVFFSTDKLQIIDTSWTRETRNHTKKYYTYPVEEGKVGTSPDVILAKNYTYYNKNGSKPVVYACVEVKIPDEKGIPDGGEYIHSCEQIARYLQNVQTAVLTNCYKWYFYEANKDIRNQEVKQYLEKIASASSVHDKKIIKQVNECMKESFDLSDGSQKEMDALKERLINIMN